KQRIKVIAEEKVASPCLSFFPNLSSSHPGRNIVGHILLKKGLSVDAVRVSVENNRPATKVGKYPVTDRPVILDEITFGNPIVRPKHLVGITDAEFWRFSGVSRRRFRLHFGVRLFYWFFSIQHLGSKIVHQRQEDRLAKQVVGSSFLEANTSNIVWLHPDMLASPRHRPLTQGLFDANRLQPPRELSQKPV